MIGCLIAGVCDYLCIRVVVRVVADMVEYARACAIVRSRTCSHAWVDVCVFRGVCMCRALSSDTAITCRTYVR